MMIIRVVFLVSPQIIKAFSLYQDPKELDKWFRNCIKVISGYKFTSHFLLPKELLGPNKLMNHLHEESKSSTQNNFLFISYQKNKCDEFNINPNDYNDYKLPFYFIIDEYFIKRKSKPILIGKDAILFNKTSCDCNHDCKESLNISSFTLGDLNDKQKIKEAFSNYCTEYIFNNKISNSNINDLIKIISNSICINENDNRKIDKLLYTELFIKEIDKLEVKFKLRVLKCIYRTIIYVSVNHNKKRSEHSIDSHLIRRTDAKVTNWDLYRADVVDDNKTGKKGHTSGQMRLLYGYFKLKKQWYFISFTDNHEFNYKNIKKILRQIS